MILRLWLKHPVPRAIVTTIVGRDLVLFPQRNTLGRHKKQSGDNDDLKPGVHRPDNLVDRQQFHQPSSFDLLRRFRLAAPPKRDPSAKPTRINIVPQNRTSSVSPRAQATTAGVNSTYCIGKRPLIATAMVIALFAGATTAYGQSHSLANLKGPVAAIHRPCPKIAASTTTAAFWRALAACSAPLMSAPLAPPSAAYPQAPQPDLILPFDMSKGVMPAWGTGGVPGPYNENEGAFRFVCGGDGPLATDDPLVHPGKPGAAHLHQVWGNKLFDAFTTSAKLAASAETNCNTTPSSLNRSSYWMPALIHDSGMVVRPDMVGVYYKRRTAASPQCTPGHPNFQGICTGIPNRIGFVFGWDQYKPTAKVQGALWYCTGAPGHYPDLDAVFKAGCKAGDTLVADTAAPNCWDGRNLDASDHRSHMAYFEPTGSCPATHPVMIPQQENKAMWTVTPDMIGADGKSRLRLSSDHMLPGAKPGQTLHADYLEAWDVRAKKAWEDNCINKGLSCSGGDLGNGSMLPGAREPVYGWKHPQPRTRLPPLDN